MDKTVVESMTNEEIVSQLNERFAESTPEEILAYFLPQYGNRIALASSLGLEDQVLTAIISKVAKKVLSHPEEVRVFTIDTGRLFPECYQLIDKTNDKYDIKIEVYSPNHEGVEQYVRENGVNAFYQSVELRKACCRCRKIEPLLRALSTLDVWICGLRASQSVTRSNIDVVEWDANNGLIKVNPLARWSEDETVGSTSRNTPSAAEPASRQRHAMQQTKRVSLPPMVRKKRFNLLSPFPAYSPGRRPP